MGFDYLLQSAAYRIGEGSHAVYARRVAVDYCYLRGCCAGTAMIICDGKTDVVGSLTGVLVSWILTGSGVAVAKIPGIGVGSQALRGLAVKLGQQSWTEAECGGVDGECGDRIDVDLHARCDGCGASPGIGYPEGYLIVSSTLVVVKGISVQAVGAAISKVPLPFDNGRRSDSHSSSGCGRICKLQICSQADCRNRRSSCEGSDWRRVDRNLAAMAV
jgi:hypothetical protein